MDADRTKQECCGTHGAAYASLRVFYAGSSKARRAREHQWICSPPRTAGSPANRPRERPRAVVAYGIDVSPPPARSTLLCAISSSLIAAIKWIISHAGPSWWVSRTRMPFQCHETQLIPLVGSSLGILNAEPSASVRVPSRFHGSHSEFVYTSGDPRHSMPGKSASLRSFAGSSTHRSPGLPPH